jgi:hypothetical protein
MFVLIPPAKPKKLNNAIGVMKGHLVFDNELQAKEALVILAPDYANQFQIVNISELEDSIIS